MPRSLVNEVYKAPGLSDFVDVPLIDVPYTTIINRAKIPDLTNNLGSSFGIDRIMVQNCDPIDDEFGANGEKIYRVAGDELGLMRIGGAPKNGFNGIISNDREQGPVVAIGVGSFFEITFYGTGLNLLTFSFNQNRDASILLNGNNYGTFTQNTTSSSSVLVSRKYGLNMCKNVVSGLTLGMHTVRLTTTTGAISIFGVEIIGSTSAIQVRPGTAYVKGKKQSVLTNQSVPHNSVFQNIYGTAGTRGGRVVAYLASDGTVKKDIQYVDVTPKGMGFSGTNTNGTWTGGQADHSNEEVVRTYYWREFGVDRLTLDEFSTLYGTTSNRSFTLHDNSTHLMGSSVAAGFSDTSLTGGTYGLGWTLATAFVSFTFIGTGVDLLSSSTVSYSGSLSVILDGSTIGNISSFNSGSRAVKIVSGLPYGTHVLKLVLNSVTAGDFRINKFVVYGPKKPEISQDAIELADYNLTANYVSNSVANVDNIATGVIRKSNTREFEYVNGTGGTANWQIDAFSTARINNFETNTNRQNAYFEYTFFGTGLEFRFAASGNRSNDITVSLKNQSTGGSLLTATTSNFPTLQSSFYGTGVNFNNATGKLDQNDPSTTGGCGMTISNLPLGVWTVRFTNNVASSYLVVDALDIITPVHVHKSQYAGGFDDSMYIGNCSISDTRSLSVSKDKSKKAWAQYYAKEDGAPTSFSTSSTSLVPVPEARLTIETSGGPIETNYHSRIQVSGAIALDHYIFVDGVNMGLVTSFFQQNDSVGNTMNSAIPNSFSAIVPISAGKHTVEIFWVVSGGTVSAQYTSRVFNVKEL